MDIPDLRSQGVLTTNIKKGIEHCRDVEATEGSSYEYSVSVGDGWRSPVLRYEWGAGVCGDGAVGGGGEEECDDGNQLDGDGCSASCRLEPHFSCKGDRSECYVLSGDGVCEEAEEEESVEDCGHFTPPGYTDQWVSRVVHDREANKGCPIPHLIGPPSNTKCVWSVKEEELWEPCDKMMEEVEVFFHTPVIATSVLVHLSSDGSGDFATNPKFLSLTLLHPHNHSTPIHDAQQVGLSCRENPVEYPLTHVLNQPFHYTLGVKIRVSDPNIAINAVRLRSWQFLDPTTINRCAEEGLLYQPDSGLCVQSHCDQLPCSKPHVQNAIVKCGKSKPDELTLSSGEHCSVSCAVGYILEKSSNSASHVVDRSEIGGLNTFCLNGVWSVEFTCVPIDCHTPAVPHAQVHCPHGTGLGKTCTFTCLSPARLIGNESRTVCSFSGTWAVPEAYCELSCRAPSTAEGTSVVLFKQCKLRFRRLDPQLSRFPMGTRCKAMCGPGFNIANQDRSRKLARLTCSEKGTWKGPKCTETTCSQPKLVYYGIYNCTRGYHVGSRCTYFCPTTKQKRVSTCLADGSWSLSYPCPLPKAVCPHPHPPRDFAVDCPDKTVIGSSCKVRCNVYLYEPVMEHIVTTEAGIRMQVLEPVPKTTCTGRKVWEPDLNSLACVKKCTQEFMGDGWCDFPNNRGYCRWDGGDCCESTVKTGRVKLMFPSFCTSHLCQCLDPHAPDSNHAPLHHAKYFTNNTAKEEEGEEAGEGELDELMDLLASVGRGGWGGGGSGEGRKVKRAGGVRVSRGESSMEELRSWFNFTIVNFQKHLLASGNDTVEERGVGEGEEAEGVEFLELLSRHYKRLFSDHQLRRGPRGRRGFRPSLFRALKKQYKRLLLKS